MGWGWGQELEVRGEGRGGRDIMGRGFSTNGLLSESAFLVSCLPYLSN